MSKIVISGYYGFGNAGDEAMLAAMIGSMRLLLPEAEFTVLSGNPSETQGRHGVKAIYRMNAFDIMRAVASCDLLVSGGGSLLQTVTSERSLYYYLSVMMLGKTFGKPVMIYSQGVGPVCGATARQAVRFIGDKLDLITVRDEGSLLELKSIGVCHPPIVVTADPVLSLPPTDQHFGLTVLKRHGLDQGDPVIGMSVREWKDQAHYKKVFASVADKLADKGAKIVFIPMQQPDVEAAERIVAMMRHPAIVVEDEYRTEELLSLVGNLDMLIGIRLHALIFAAVMNVPLVGVSYDPKIERFLESIGQTAVGTLQDITAEKLYTQALAAWPRLGTERRISEQVRELRKKAFKSAELAVGLLQKSRRG